MVRRGQEARLVAGLRGAGEIAQCRDEEIERGLAL
jgi:hypothetical protein